MGIKELDKWKSLYAFLPVFPLMPTYSSVNLDIHLPSSRNIYNTRGSMMVWRTESAPATVSVKMLSGNVLYKTTLVSWSYQVFYQLPSLGEWRKEGVLGFRMPWTNGSQTWHNRYLTEILQNCNYIIWKIWLKSLLSEKPRESLPVPSFISIFYGIWDILILKTI